MSRWVVVFIQLFNWIDLRLKVDPAWSQYNLLFCDRIMQRGGRVFTKSRETSFHPISVHENRPKRTGAPH